MIQTLYRSLAATLLLTLLCCGIYPAAVTLIGQVAFPAKALGGLVNRGDATVGAALIGQSFARPGYFHGRPSAAGDKGYDAANSSGSNLGPTNQKFADGLRANVDAFLRENPAVKKGEVPADLVTASASGLDPHVSPEGARAQLGRVARARGVSVPELSRLIEGHVEGPQWGIFGEAVVNVLLLNLDLDRIYPVKK